MSNDVNDWSESSDGAVEERVVSFLRSSDRPRHVASDVAVALDLTRGRVRTGLQTLADEGRVVRTDDGTTARWAVTDRADEPDAVPGAERDATAETDEDGVTEAADGSVTEAAPEPESAPPPESASDATIGRSRVGERRRGEGMVRAVAVFLGLAVAVAVLRRLRRR